MEKRSHNTVNRRQTLGPEGLSRSRILEAALALVDDQGLDQLSMRRLATTLGVEAMSLYRHVPGKDALLDGLAEVLWSQVRLPDSGAMEQPWHHAIRPTARSIRALAQQHPNAFPLVLSNTCLPQSAWRVFGALLETLRGAGFDGDMAGYAMDIVVAYSVGNGLVELACGCGQPDLVAQVQKQADSNGQFQDVARAWCTCDPNRQFDLGLDALLSGLDALRCPDQRH